MEKAEDFRDLGEFFTSLVLSKFFAAEDAPTHLLVRYGCNRKDNSHCPSVCLEGEGLQCSLRQKNNNKKTATRTTTGLAGECVCFL